MKFHFRTSLLILGCLTTVATTMAAPRTQTQMKSAAVQAINAQRTAKRMAPRQASELKTLKSTATYQILGFNDTGFAVIATDDLVPEVLGVSTARYSEGRNPNFQWWLNAINEVVTYAVSNQVQLATTKPDPTLYPTSVGPLLTTHWDQETPYNNLCPSFSNAVRCLTGCVATAMAQVLNYHQQPQHGIGQRTIYYNGQPVTADFENDYYDWDNMLDDYNEGQYNQQQALAVATLMRDCGVAADMEYGGPEEGSGAYSTEAAAGLRDYFGFAEAECLERDYYSEQAWMDIVYRELSENGPLYYGGADWAQGGHAFVLHGYNAEGKVLVNWGWSGDDDGFFDIALLNPSWYTFSYGQDMIIGVKGQPRELTDEVVELTEPGTLRDVLGDDKIGTVGTLKLTGAINSSDVLQLRKLAGIDEFGEKTNGYLHTIDLSDARFVTGGSPYIIDGSKRLTTDNDILPERAFYNCRNLKSLHLPKGIRHWGDGALARCPMLSDVEMGEPAADADFVVDGTTIWNSDQTEIIAILPSAEGTLNIPKGTTILHDYAVAGCCRLSKVLIPTSVTRIGREGFRDCSTLTEIRVATKEAPELGGANVFSGVAVHNCNLYVPSGTKIKYSRLAQWSSFVGDGYDCIVEYGTTLKVRNAIRYYGAENPTFYYRVEGDPVEGEHELTCEATPSSPAGRYPITIKYGTITDETVELVDGYLIIQKVKATATVEDCTRKQGQPNPEFTLTYTGLVNDELLPIWSEQPVITTTATEDSPVGEYPIIVESGTAESYELTFIAGTLTVTEATTAISDDIRVNDNREGSLYDLQGRKLSDNSRLPKGIYIINGKKFVVK